MISVKCEFAIRDGLRSANHAAFDQSSLAASSDASRLHIPHVHDHLPSLDCNRHSFASKAVNAKHNAIARAVISDVTSRHVTLRTGGQPFTFVYEMAVKQTTKRGLLPGYFEGIQLKETKERYLDKLADIGRQDPYEIP